MPEVILQEPAVFVVPGCASPSKSPCCRSSAARCSALRSASCATCACRLWPKASISTCCSWRGTPLLVVLFICYFALPALLGYKTAPIGPRSAGSFCSSRLIWPKTSAPDCDRCAGSRPGRPRDRSHAREGVAADRRADRAAQCHPNLFNQYVRLFKFHLGRVRDRRERVHRQRHAGQWPRIRADHPHRFHRADLSGAVLAILGRRRVLYARLATRT